MKARVKPKKPIKKTSKKASGGNFLSHRLPFSRKQALVLIAFLVAIGGYIIYYSLADSGGLITADNCFNCNGANGATKFTENANSKNPFSAIALSSGVAGATENYLVIANGLNLDPGLYTVCLNLKTPGHFVGNLTAQPLASVMTAKTQTYTVDQNSDYTQISPCMQNVAVTTGGGGMTVALTNISGSTGPTVDIASVAVLRSGDLPAKSNWPDSLNPMLQTPIPSNPNNNYTYKNIARTIYGTNHYLTTMLGSLSMLDSINSNLNYNGPTDWETNNVFTWADKQGANTFNKGGTIDGNDGTTTPGAGTMTGVPAIGDPYIDSLNFYALATCESGMAGGNSQGYAPNDADGGGQRYGAFQNSDWAWHWGGDFEKNASADPYPHAYDAPLWYQYYRNKRIFLKSLVYGPAGTSTAYRYPPETGHQTCGSKVFTGQRPDSEQIY